MSKSCDYSAGPAPNGTGVLIGRKRELGTLRRLLGSSAEQRSALVSGEAGIGKTRLVEEFLKIARRRGFQIIRGCCYREKEAGPYFPFYQIVRQLCGGAPLSHDLQRALTGRSGSRGSSFHLDEDTRSRRSLFVRSVSDLILNTVQGKRTVIFIEDLHWADIGSLLVTNCLVDTAPSPLIVVCTARLDEAASPDARLLLTRIEHKGSHVAVSGLSHIEVARLLYQIAGDNHLKAEEVDELRSFTGGNPLYLKELVAHLDKTRLLERHSLREALERCRSPAGLAHVIDLHFGELAADERALLSVCSVLGGEFAADAVAALLSAPEGEAIERLDQAVVRGVLERIDDLGTNRYRFAHPLYRLNLYDQLPTRERKRLHRLLVQATEAGSVHLGVMELAHHQAVGTHGYASTKTVGYCEQAAEAAEASLAYEIAARFWELALKAARGQAHARRAELYRRVGWALWAAGNWNSARQAWLEAVQLFERGGADRERAELALALGEVCRWLQDLTDSEHWLNVVLQLPEADPAHRERALILLGSIRCLRDDPGEALTTLRNARALWIGGGQAPSVAYWLSYGFLIAGDQETALSVAKEGLSEAQRRGASTAVVLLAGGLVVSELSRLRLDAALANLRIAEDALDQNDTGSLIHSLVRRCFVFGYMGRWREIIALCERWASAVRLTGRYQLATAKLVSAAARIELGEAKAARYEIESSLSALGRMRPVATLYLARALLQLGKEENALSLVREYVRETPQSRPTSAEQVMLGDIASELDVPEVWTECYELLKAEGRKVVLVYGPFSVQRVLGRLAGRLRRWPAAISHFNLAVGQLSEGRAEWELAKTYLDYAGMRQRRGRRGDLGKAAAYELQATALLEALGVTRTALPAGSTVGDRANRFGLTARELEVLALIAEGKRNYEIADALFVSRWTVNRHVENILVRTGAANRAEAAARAIEDGLLGPARR